MSTQRQSRGEAVVNAGVDFVSGIGRAFGSLGTRIQRGRYAAFIDGFCAVVGDVASQNGRFLPVETEGLKRFLLYQQDSPVFRAYGVDEVQEKLKTFAVAAFLGEEEKIVRALRAIEPASDEARMIILAALAVAFADGECDDREAACIADYARRLNVDAEELARGFGLALPTARGETAPLLIGQSTTTSGELLPAPQPHLEPAPEAPPPDADLSMSRPASRPAPDPAPDPVPPPTPVSQTQASQPLCRRCWSFLVAGNPRCDCGRDLRNDIAVH